MKLPTQGSCKEATLLWNLKDWTLLSFRNHLNVVSKFDLSLIQNSGVPRFESSVIMWMLVTQWQVFEASPVIDCVFHKVYFHDF